MDDGRPRQNLRDRAVNGRVPLAFPVWDTASGVASCEARVNGNPRAAASRCRPRRSARRTRSADGERPRRPRDEPDVHVHRPHTRNRRTRAVPRAPATFTSYRRCRAVDDADAPDRYRSRADPPRWWVAGLSADRVLEQPRRHLADHRMDSDGTDVTLLPTARATRPSLRGRPTAGRIAFVSTRSGNPDVWVGNFEGSGLQRLPTDSKARRVPDVVAAGCEPDRGSNGPAVSWTSGGCGRRGRQDAPDDDAGPQYGGCVGLRQHDRIRRAAPRVRPLR